MVCLFGNTFIMHGGGSLAFSSLGWIVATKFVFGRIYGVQR